MQFSKKILIVEDDVNLLYGLQAKLRVEGFEVITDGGSGEIIEVLEKVAILKPDYIILDIMLPGINGLDLLREIKGKPVISKIPVFIFTNLSDNDSRELARKFGADIYLVKTDFNLDEFVVKLKKIISSQEKIK